MKGWRLPAGFAMRPSAATAAASAATTTAAEGTLRLRARFVDVQLPPVQLSAVQGGDCLGCGVVISHFHETKSAGTAGIAVRHHLHAGNLTERLEQRPQVALRGLEVHITHKDILHFLYISLSRL